jgi:hypothetical protein
VRGCRYKKLINSNRYNSRYRYHKNSIINKGLLSLVGFSLLLPMFPCRDNVIFL